MNTLLHFITSYMDYLKQEYRQEISIHFRKSILQSLPQKACVELLPYNCHENPYCIAVKKKKHHKCIESQAQVRSSCKKNKSFCRSCHAGVYEYIYPVFKSEDVAGFIAVSGYRKDADKDISIDCPVWDKHLCAEDIPTELFDTLIPPLAVMLEKLFETYCIEEKNEYNLILQYLNEYHSTVTVSDLCKHFGRSPSHISHMFKQKCGISVKEYCTSLKLQDAKKLLLTTDSPVTQIAFDVGFNDVSHFISVFKKKFGVSPLRYRKTHLSEF
ncbi:MAG: helix-turn-helix transcriptional regulator [Oscillospiraceae bacterium]|nr:helix-turn-helix transcriptional regulator [Oscillospiraceae bacterium]